MTIVHCALRAHPQIGECPVWASEEGTLYWADIFGPSINRFDPVHGTISSWTVPTIIGSFALTKTGRLLVALKTGLFLFDTAAATFKLVASLGDVGRVSRFNDGKVSPDGRFFVGTMDESYPRQATASLYRFDPDGSFTKLVEGLTVSNGLAWSPDGRVMYHSDSRQQVIWTYDYDLSSGAISNGREMARPTEEIGRPDGAATDMEGYYWSAGVSSGCVNRYRPDGTIERSIRMPCPAPTMPCFGGPDLKTVYVTSLRRNLGPDVLAAFPLSGSLFSFEAPAPGVEIPRFDDRHFA